jgi:S1-C subfamily serine protease
MINDGLKRFLGFLFTLLGLTVFGGEAWADQLSAMRLYAAKKYGEAFQEFLPLAQGGNPVAQFFVAVIFDNGQSVPVDRGAAASWYRRAAAQGHPSAQLRLAIMFSLGEGIEKDQVQGLKWAILAAQGDLPSDDHARATRLRDALMTTLPLEQRESARSEAAAWSPRPESQSGPVAQDSGSTKLLLRKRGSGFFVDRSGHFLTNHHVVDGCGQLRFERPHGGGMLQIVGVDAVRDLALLKATSPASDHVVFVGTLAKPGDGVVIVGYPLVGPEVLVTAGIVSARVGSRGEPGLLQLSAGIVPGGSGSPVFDETGAVLGIVSRRSRGSATGDQQELIAGSIALAAAVARHFLEVNGVTPTIAASRNVLTMGEIVTRGSRATASVECWR